MKKIVGANKRFHWPYDFSLVQNYRISILSLVKEIVLSFFSQNGRRVAEGARELFERLADPG